MHLRPNHQLAPGPRGTVLLGNLREFRRDVLGLLESSARDYGDVVRFRLGPQVIHLINSPEYVEHVLQSNQKNYERANTRSVNNMRMITGDSLLTLSGEEWRAQRRMIQPVFHHQHLRGFRDCMVEETGKMLERWRELAAGGREIELCSEMSRLTYSIVGRTLFGADISADAETVERSMAVVLEHIYHRLEHVLNLPAIFPTPANRRFREALDGLDDVVYRMIAQRKERSREGADLLSLMMRARDPETGEGLSDVELRNETITLLLAGHETTANALSWTFHHLSRHPEMESRLRNEVSDVLAERLPQTEDLSRLLYTSAVLNESMRLSPPIWAAERHVINDDEIGGYHIPAGSTVVVSAYVLHRHQAYWSDPEAFQPERFLQNGEIHYPKGAFLPFGAGAHQCIGSHFAMMEARIILSMILQKFRLQPVEGHPVEPNPGITLRPRDGLRMHVCAV